MIVEKRQQPLPTAKTAIAGGIGETSHILNSNPNPALYLLVYIENKFIIYVLDIKNLDQIEMHNSF